MQPSTDPVTLTTEPFFIKGLYSLMILREGSGLPNITMFRRSPEILLKLKDSLIKRPIRNLTGFVIRQSVHRLDYYGPAGDLQPHQCSILDFSSRREEPCRKTLFRQGHGAVGGSADLAVYANHAGVSAASRANFQWLLTHLVKIADNDSIKAFALLDSQVYDFRFTMLLGNLAKVDREIQDLYLDARHHLVSELPLNLADLRYEFIEILATPRWHETEELIRQSLPKSDVLLWGQMENGLVAARGDVGLRRNLSRCVMQLLDPDIPLHGQGPDPLPENLSESQQRALRRMALKGFSEYWDLLRPLAEV